jgi:hypothetical protein
MSAFTTRVGEGFTGRAATLAALRAGRERSPALEAVLAAGDAPSNPFFGASRPTG